MATIYSPSFGIYKQKVNLRYHLLRKKNKDLTEEISGIFSWVGLDKDGELQPIVPPSLSLSDEYSYIILNKNNATLGLAPNLLVW